MPEDGEKSGGSLTDIPAFFDSGWKTDQDYFEALC